MIKFINPQQSEPYLKFDEKYHEALSKNQPNIEAVSISSFSFLTNEVDSRMVNIKFLDEENFIFFSNYNSVKAKQFESHNQIVALIYWQKINVQIKMKAKIKKTSNSYNEHYFKTRDYKKNALSLSSSQSQPIESYAIVKKNYNKSLNNDNLKVCPIHWGGYAFKPYYFEFWEGHESRINKREVFERFDETWTKSILQP